MIVGAFPQGGMDFPDVPSAGETVLHSKTGNVRTNSTGFVDVGSGWGFTALRAGIYRIQVIFRPWGNGSGARIQLVQNGSIVAGSDTLHGDWFVNTIKTIDVNCATGDLIKLQHRVQNSMYETCVSMFQVSILAADVQAAINEIIAVS